MSETDILDRISQGRTDLVFELLAQPDWRGMLMSGPFRPLQWFVYYNDVTALKAVLAAGGDLASIDLDTELGHASFFGHWKVCDFLIANGADVNSSVADTAETPLHNALAKAGRPYFLYVVRLLVENGADVNARTMPGQETGAFMRDVRTRGETPLHRAAAYADVPTIEFLLKHGADPGARDAHGASPMTWASEHLRPRSILALVSNDEHYVGAEERHPSTSDHGAGWGNGMDWKFIGDYLPESRS